MHARLNDGRVCKPPSFRHYCPISPCISISTFSGRVFLHEKKNTTVEINQCAATGCQSCRLDSRCSTSSSLESSRAQIVDIARRVVYVLFISSVSGQWWLLDSGLPPTPGPTTYCRVPQKHSVMRRIVSRIKKKSQKSRSLWQKGGYKKETWGPRDLETPACHRMLSSRSSISHTAWQSHGHIRRRVS